LHVDGGVSTPFFTVPPSALSWTEPSGLLRRAQLYVIINGQVEHAPLTTNRAAVSVFGRSLDFMQLSLTRSTFNETRSFCERNGIAFRATAIPTDAGSFGTLDVSEKTRTRLFSLGERLGASGDAWNLAKPAA